MASRHGHAGQEIPAMGGAEMTIIISGQGGAKVKTGQLLHQALRHCQIQVLLEQDVATAASPVKAPVARVDQDHRTGRPDRLSTGQTSANKKADPDQDGN